MAFQHQVGFGTLIESTSNDAVPPHCSPFPAHGCVYALRQFEVDELIRKEKGYTLQAITVQALDDGTIFEARAFISSPWHMLDAPVAPTRRYAELVLGGAVERKLPDEYVDWLRAERNSAKASSGVPSAYYKTKSRRAAALIAGGLASTLVGFPVTRRVVECSPDWKPGTSCETFFVPERFR